MQMMVIATILILNQNPNYFVPKLRDLMPCDPQTKCPDN